MVKIGRKARKVVLWGRMKLEEFFENAVALLKQCQIFRLLENKTKFYRDLNAPG